MKYNQNWLNNFDGNIKPSEIDVAALINSIEANVSQKRYKYKTNLNEMEEITIEVKNVNIPHLLGLSKNHHFGLSTYSPEIIFNKLKKDWNLNYLITSDERWFLQNQDKLIGVLLLFQLLNLKKCEVYTTIYNINKQSGKRFKRDNIYFIIFKVGNNQNYTIELSPIKNKENVYFPRSLKINDSKVLRCTKISLKLLRSERLYSKKKKK